MYWILVSVLAYLKAGSLSAKSYILIRLSVTRILPGPDRLFSLLIKKAN